MTYKAIIADDEKELRRYLKTMLAETWPDLEICGEAANGKEALELVDTLAIRRLLFWTSKCPVFPVLK